MEGRLPSAKTSEYQENESENEEIANVGPWPEMADGTRACRNCPSGKDAGSLQIPENGHGPRAAGDEVHLEFRGSDGHE